MEVLMSESRLIHHLNNLGLLRDVDYKLEYSVINSDNDFKDAE